MLANHRLQRHRLALGLALIGLLASGMMGYWFGVWRGPAATNALAGEPGKQEKTPLAPGERAIPVVAVLTRCPGLSPQAVESEITNRLEQSLKHAQGLRMIESKSMMGQSIVQLHFDETVPPAVALAQTAGLAAMAVPHFPSRAGVPEVAVVDASRPLPACLLVMDHPNLTLQQQAGLARQYLLPELTSLAGIAARLGPAPERVVAVTLDPAKVQAHKVSLQAIHTALEEGAAELPTGMIQVGPRQLLLKTSPLRLDDLANLPIGDGKRFVYVRDLAQIADSYAAPTALAHVNGRRRVWVAIHARPGLRAAAANDAVRKLLAKLQQRLPKAATLELLTFGNERDAEAGVVTLHLRAAAGTRLEACEKLLSQVEQYLETTLPRGKLRFMVAQVGPDPTVSAAWTSPVGPHQAILRLQLSQPAGAREFVKLLRQLLRERFPDLRASIHAGSGTTWPAVVSVGGGTAAQCEKAAALIVDRIAKLKAVTDVETGERLPGVQLHLDPKSAEVGIARADVQRALLAAGAELNCRASVAQAGTDSQAKVRVVLRLPESNFRTLQELSNFPIGNVPIPLGNLAKVKLVDALAEVEHQNLSRVVTIRVNTDEADRASFVKGIESLLKDVPLAEGMWLKVPTAP